LVDTIIGSPKDEADIDRLREVMHHHEPDPPADPQP
jgi:hypothetical protein